jgi:hypothetical protein
MRLTHLLTANRLHEANMNPHHYDSQEAQRLHIQRVGNKFILGSIAFSVSFMALCIVIMLAI